MLQRLQVSKVQTIVHSERVLQEVGPRFYSHRFRAEQQNYTPRIRAALLKPMSDRPSMAQRLREAVDHHTRLPWTEHHIIEECVDHM
jgi:hypothetical protein